MEFIYKLLSDSNDVSHRRFISMMAFIAFLALVVASCFGVKIDYTLAAMLLSLCLGQSAYTLVKKPNTPQQ